MSYLVNLDLRKRHVVVVGAGSVALRKVAGLLEAGACVTVVAPSACPEVLALRDAGRLCLVERSYLTGDLEGATLAVAATDDEAVNARISADAVSARVPINVVDRPPLCTFTLPAVVRRGDLTIAVATEGRCPAMAQALREELEARYGREYGEAAALLGDLRRSLIGAGWNGARVRSTLKALYRKGVAQAIASGDRERLHDLLAGEVGEDFVPPLGPA